MLAREYCHLAEHCVQISAEQGQFFRLLIRFADARRIITVGTCTDYSALCMTQATGSHRHLVCCDISTEWTDTAQEYWARVGVFERIDLRTAPAHSPMDWDWRKELRVHRSVLEEFVLHKDDDAVGKLKPQKVLLDVREAMGPEDVVAIDYEENMRLAKHLGEIIRRVQVVPPGGFEPPVRD